MRFYWAVLATASIGLSSTAICGGPEFCRAGAARNESGRRNKCSQPWAAWSCPGAQRILITLYCPCFFVVIFKTCLDDPPVRYIVERTKLKAYNWHYAVHTLPLHYVMSLYGHRLMALNLVQSHCIVPITSVLQVSSVSLPCPLKACM